MNASPQDPEPPPFLDAARVLEYATFDAEVHASRGASSVMDGVAVDLQNVAGLVIAEGLAQGELYLLHCNERWETITAGSFADAATARAEAEKAFPGVERLWRPYRELTAEEGSEMQTTRAFLRELLADDPDAGA